MLELRKKYIHVVISDTTSHWLACRPIRSQYAATLPAHHLPTVPSVLTQRTIGLCIVSHYHCAVRYEREIIPMLTRPGLPTIVHVIQVDWGRCESCCWREVHAARELKKTGQRLLTAHTSNVTFTWFKWLSVKASARARQLRPCPFFLANNINNNNNNDNYPHESGQLHSSWLLLYSDVTLFKQLSAHKHNRTYSLCMRREKRWLQSCKTVHTCSGRLKGHLPYLCSVAVRY